MAMGFIVHMNFVQALVCGILLGDTHVGGDFSGYIYGKAEILSRLRWVGTFDFPNTSIY